MAREMESPHQDALFEESIALQPKRMDPAELNPAQKEAVEHIDGPMLTLAGPGSGKTRVVTHRIANLLEHGISPYSILALTFTNKAAREMRNRLKTIVGDEPVWMGTFHGYCASFLRRYASFVGLTPNYSIFDVNDADKALKQAITEAKVSLTHLTESQIAKEISELKNRLVLPEECAQNSAHHQSRVIAKVYEHYQKLLLKCAAVDFDDLLMHTALVLKDNEELRTRLDSLHRYILVDEYQDTNFAQYMIIRMLSHRYPNINATGDPDQSIYGWRGANIGNILNFERDFPNVKIVRLEQNYRSSPQILSAADSVIKHNKQRKAKTLIPTRPDGSPVQVKIYPSDKDEAEAIVAQIYAAVLRQQAVPSHYAILYRTNAQSRLLEHALVARKIGYQLIGGFRFYERKEVKDLVSYLKLVNNPLDDMAFSRVINCPTRGLGAKAIEKVATLAESKGLSMLAALRLAIPFDLLSGKGLKGAKDFLNLFDKLNTMSTGSVAEMLELIVKETKYLEHAKDSSEDSPDRSVEENVRELISAGAQVDAEFTEGSGLEAFLEQVSLTADTDGWNSTSDKVTLMTLHSCKGLEFERVFIIAVEHEVLPHKRSLDSPEQVEEERRLFFVGITRAKQELQISLAHTRGFQGRYAVPSRFISELPAKEIERIDLSEGNAWDDDRDFDREFAEQKSRWSKKFKSGEFSDDFVSDVGDVFDDACQLPPEELQTRSKKRGKVSLDGLGITLKKGSEVSSPESTMWFVGDRVIHPTYGPGEIISLTGRGLKQIARIMFDESNDPHSFFVAKCALQRQE